MSQQKTVAIIIINFNNWQDTLECLESVLRIGYPAFQVIVVDNHSVDDSLSHLENWAAGKLCSWLPRDFRLRSLSNPPVDKPLFYQLLTWDERTEDFEIAQPSNLSSPDQSQAAQLTLIRSPHNRGFAGGNNIGIQYALRQKIDYFLLLNNDTVVSHDFLSPLVRAIESGDQTGMAGGKIMFYHQPDLIWAAGGGKITRITSGMHHIGVNQPDGPRYARPFDCDYITGCLLLTSRKVISEIGLMDENYFLYYEETDWNLQAAEAGFRRVYTPESVIYHKASVSLASQNLLITYYYTRNRIYLVKKNYQGFYKSVTLIYLFKYNIIRILYNLVKLNFPKSRIIALGLIHGFFAKMGGIQKNI